MIKLSAYIYFLLLRTILCYYTINMNKDSQLVRQSLTLNDDNYFLNQNQIIAFGIWSRYNPLSDIGQVGQIGIFDSNCFHYINAASLETEQINFIYYDCLDEDNQIIKKNVQFLDENNEIHQYSLLIDKYSYENIWYYFQIVTWPFIKQFQLIVIKYPNIILNEKLEIKYPFYDKDLIMTFGGGVNGYFGTDLMFQSYFPGKLMLYPLDQDQYDYPFDFYYAIMDSSDTYCRCFENMIGSVIMTQTLSFSDLVTYQSWNTNCEFFQLAGWLKIKKEMKSKKYKFIKISQNSQGTSLTNDNLSPFTLNYIISDDKNQIIFTTYSYDFPSLRLDFSTNPNLITTEIDVTNNIYLWHYLIVNLKDGQLSLDITFFEDINYFHYESIISVRQFNIVKYQIQIGNLEQEQEYLIIEGNQILFKICETGFISQICDINCEQCDGPTNLDCVICKAPRMFVPELQTCVCPYGTLAGFECVTLQQANIQIYMNSQKFHCQYGEFRIDQQCFQCPSIISENEISCLECLQNPDSWYEMLYCKQNLISYNGNTFTSQTLGISEIFHFVFDGEGITYCKNCQNCSGDECQKSSLEEKQTQMNKFCWTTDNQNCQTCGIYECGVCGLSQEQGIICQKCKYHAHMENGQCLVEMSGSQQYCFENCSYCQGNCWACYQPYYLNTQKSKCELCTIKNCKYCFMFQINDLTMTTLYKDFVAFNPDENTQIGCSLCYDGYNYDFIKMKCILGSPQIVNCLRSFINLENKEICVVSAIFDFQIAPQISNCQIQIKNCEQCLKISNSQLKCIICEQGYSVSVSTGQCDFCQISNAYNCIEGQYYLQDYWVQLIQSFMALFLPNNYYYPQSQQDYLIVQFPLKCLQGYQPNRNTQCAKICDESCLSCQEDEFNLNFVCKQCKTNYYGQPNLSVSGNTCLICPLLCLVCQKREPNEIQLINPYFQPNDQNYQYKCLKAIDNQNIVLDPELQIAAYCFDNECSRSYIYSDNLDCYNFQYSDYYENYINTDFCNMIGIKQFTVKFFLLDYNCFFGDLIVESNLKKKIFSLQETSIIIIETDGNVYPPMLRYKISNFDKVMFDNLKFFLISGNIISITNQNKPVDLSISRAVFFSNGDEILTDIEFQIQINRNLNFTNITLSNLNMKDLIWLNYVSDLNEEIIEIFQFFIFNCSFDNVTLLSFKTYSKPINITQMQIYNSNFSNSIIIQLGTSLVISESSSFQGIIVQKNNFNNSIFILNEGSHQVDLRYISFVENYFYKSIVVQSVWNVNSTQTLLENNEFCSSYFFKATFQTIQQSSISFIFQYYYILSSQFIDSSLFYIHQPDYEQNALLAKFSNFKHFNLTSQETTTLIFLYDLECWEVNVNQFNIYEPWNLPYFRIYQTYSSNFKNIIYQSTRQPWKMPTSSGCLQNTTSSPLLIHIQGFAEINLHNISIVNQFSIDYSIIHILSDILYSPSNEEKIIMTDLYFYGNILLKNSLGNMLSLIVIYSDRLQQIYLNNITYEENFFNQIVDDPSQMTSSLLYIYSQQSAIQINNLKCLSNGLTNSSYTFITINSLSIFINNYSVINCNLQQYSIRLMNFDFEYKNFLAKRKQKKETLDIFNNTYKISKDFKSPSGRSLVLSSTIVLDQSTWLKYYKIDTNLQLPFDVFNHLIQHLFTIQTGNGVGQFASSKFSLSNSFFNNILSLSNSVMQITTQGQGMINIHNITVINASVLLNQAIEVDGCLSIHSQGSLLHLTITNAYFESIKNRFGSAIITIYPSQKENLIVFSNLTVFNCYSLLNQFIAVEFSKESNLQNFVTMNNLNFTITEKGWNQYLSEIGSPSNLEIKKITSANALINLHDCSVVVNNFYITGILHSPVFIMTDNLKIIMTKVNIINIQTLYPFHLVQFSQPQQNQNRINLYLFSISNTSQLFASSEQYNYLTKVSQINTIHLECLSTQIEINLKSSNKTINLLIDLLNENFEQKGSLIYIQGISDISQVNFDKISLIYNNCSFCYEGLLYLLSISPDHVKIKGLNCYGNQIKGQGCINLMNQGVSQTLLSIEDSAFVKNNGQQGVGVHSSKTLFLIKNSVFIENRCTQLGGAIYAETISNNFSIKNSIITNNKANIGGGIVFSGENYLNQQNFMNSFNLFNNAKLYAQNLVEAPHHIDLSINNQNMNSIEFIEQSNTIQQLQLHPYRTIQQGKSIQTDTLLLPSDQEIYDYRLFNPKKMISLNYITDFSFVLKNSINEELVGNSDDECLLLQRNISISNSIFEDFQNLSSYKFNIANNRFDLSQLSVNFDPYSDDNQMLQLRFQCRSHNKQLTYQINTKTFRCQLGEFYVSNGCQICQSTYGFYSVTYNSSKCSIFDKMKFKNITSNNLQILPGYWRPNILSDATEECFKNRQWCISGWGVGNELCYNGHVGGLCEECDTYNIRGDGYYFKTGSKQCILCGENQNEILLPILIVIIWTFITTLLTLKSINKTNKVFAILKAQNKLFEILFKLTQDFESILLKMFLNYFWIFSVIFTFNITFGFSLDVVDQTNNPSYVMALSLDCSLAKSSNIQLIYLRLIAMILFLILQVIVISGGFKLHSFFAKIPYDFGIICNTVIYLFVSNHGSLIKNLSSLISSRTISDIEYIQGNVDLLFNNEEHLKWIFAFILPGLIIFGLSIPFLMFIILYLCKKRFNQSQFRKYLGYLYNEYNKETYFWEQIKLWKRSLIILIMTYFETNISIKAAFINLTLICYLLLAIKSKPYIIKSLNQLDIQSGLIVSITLFLAEVKYISEQSNNFFASMVLQILILLLCLKLCFSFLFRMLQQYIKKYKLLVLQMLHRIFFSIKSDSYLTFYFQKELKSHTQRRQQLQHNYEKLRSCLLTISKFQIEHQRKMICNFPSSRVSRLYIESDHIKFTPQSRTTLQ